ncbi:MAG: TetR/AcrR family transcriptional regulator [Clostridia bacterium]|nr:TetR/AcrR family transcriptional regulator [Clostridia bacterium]
MARLVDPNKIEDIKVALMELVGDFGINAVSIKMLAEKASVSTGYLYRHYSGKDEMVMEIGNEWLDEFNTKVALATEKGDTIESFVVELTKWMLTMAKGDYVSAKFMVRLFVETLFDHEDRKYFCNKREKELAMIRFFERSNNEILHPDLDFEECFHIMVLIMMNFLLTKFDNNKKIDIEKETEIISNICLNAIRK